MRFFVSYIGTPLLWAIITVLSAVVVIKDNQIDTLKHQLTLVEQKSEARKQLVEEARQLERELGNPRVRKVTVTAYNPSADQCDDDPMVAASMRKVRAGTIAVSRDLFDQGWVFGRKVRIEGLGIFEINDLMNKRYSRRIDVFMWDEAKAKAFGKRVSKAALLEI